jgi:hypothetical protein
MDHARDLASKRGPHVLVVAPPPEVFAQETYGARRRSYKGKAFTGQGYDSMEFPHGSLLQGWRCALASC